MNTGRGSKIYLEAILDQYNNCEKNDYSRIFKINSEQIFMKNIINDNVAILTYAYWKSLEDKLNISKNTIILIDKIDMKRINKTNYYNDKKYYETTPNVEFREVEQYNSFIIFQIQNEFKNLDLFILGDSRLFWTCFDLADKLIITYVDDSININKCNLTEFPKIKNEEWRECMGSIIDNSSYVIEYDRINIKGWE